MVLKHRQQVNRHELERIRHDELSRLAVLRTLLPIHRQHADDVVDDFVAELHGTMLGQLGKLLLHEELHVVLCVDLFEVSVHIICHLVCHVENAQLSLTEWTSIKHG